MILDRNENKEVAVLLGAGSMGMAILRRVAAGKKILLGGRRPLSSTNTAVSATLKPLRSIIHIRLLNSLSTV